MRQCLAVSQDSESQRDEADSVMSVQVPAWRTPTVSSRLAHRACSAV